MPPAPIRPTISYTPRRAPGARDMLLRNAGIIPVDRVLLIPNPKSLVPEPKCRPGYRTRVYRRAIPVAALCVIATIGPSRTSAQSPGVTWTNIVNATVIGHVLQKTGGCDGVDDAGATSQQSFTAGDGYVQFTVGETNTFWFAGLGHGDEGTVHPTSISRFVSTARARRTCSKTASIAGGDTPYAAGDVFRVAIVGGRVQYIRNGQFLRESARRPSIRCSSTSPSEVIGATVRQCVLGVRPAAAAGRRASSKQPDRRRCVRDSPSANRGSSSRRVARKVRSRFPAPYNTTGVRLTNATDCAGGADCLWYVGYSYWRNMNNHVGSADMYIFLGTDPQSRRSRTDAAPVQQGARIASRILGRSSPPDVHSAAAPAKAGISAARNRRGSTRYIDRQSQLRRYDILSGNSRQCRRLDLTHVRGRACVPRHRPSSSSRIRATTTSCIRPRCRTPTGGASAA